MADESPEEPFKEDLPDWIGQVEDRAWLAARDAAVSRFVLGNLVLELGQRGAIDARQFIARLQAAAPLHPDRRISRRSRNFWWSFNVACPHLMQAAAVARPALLGCFTSEGAGRGHINGGRLGAAQWAAAQQGLHLAADVFQSGDAGSELACIGAHFFGPWGW